MAADEERWMLICRGGRYGCRPPRPALRCSEVLATSATDFVDSHGFGGVVLGRIAAADGPQLTFDGFCAER